MVTSGGQKTLDRLMKAFKFLIICELLMIQKITNERMGLRLVGKIAEKHLGESAGCLEASYHVCHKPVHVTGTP